MRLPCPRARLPWYRKRQETAYLDQVVCRAIPRAASRLPSRARVCDTRRAWRDMEEEAVRETQRLLNMNAYNNRAREPGH